LKGCYFYGAFSDLQIIPFIGVRIEKNILRLEGQESNKNSVFREALNGLSGFYLHLPISGLMCRQVVTKDRDELLVSFICWRMTDREKNIVCTK
jgi:hypothetical protein